VVVVEIEEALTGTTSQSGATLDDCVEKEMMVSRAKDCKQRKGATDPECARDSMIKRVERGQDPRGEGECVVWSGLVSTWTFR
jgi:hypothetical protein